MIKSLVRRPYRYRFYPTERQESELIRAFGCIRVVYNKALEVRVAAWSSEERRVSFYETSAMLTAWKKTDDLAFLKEVPSVPLQQALRHLERAFVNFYEKRAKHPRFKARKTSKASAEYTRSGFRWCNGQLRLQKMADALKIVWSRPLPEGAEPSRVTVSRDAAGRWFVSILVEAVVTGHPRAIQAVGVDVGITDLLTLSTGEKVANPMHERRDHARLARAQRALARKVRGSANREKARRKVARVHARISDRRRDHLHKVTTRLIRENQVVVIEDLNVRGMMRNGKMARVIADASWSTMRSMLKYKAAWYGREVITVSRWLPSSKTCSSCGVRLDCLPLRVREWTCTCGAVHDRDVNAARNILAAGLAAAACGGGVRPTRCRSARQRPQPSLEEDGSRNLSDVSQRKVPPAGRN